MSARNLQPIPEDVFGNSESPAISFGPWLEISSTTLWLQAWVALVEWLRLVQELALAPAIATMQLTLCTAEVMLFGTNREMALRSLQRFDSISIGLLLYHTHSCSPYIVSDVANHAMQCLSLSNASLCSNNLCCRNHTLYCFLGCGC